jgi:hypothetical protein
MIMPLDTNENLLLPHSQASQNLKLSFSVALCSLSALKLG